jgi:hypothetical protein
MWGFFSKLNHKIKYLLHFVFNFVVIYKFLNLCNYYKKPTVTETVILNRLCWFRHVQRVGVNRISKGVLYMNLETKRLRDRPRNRWQNEVREDRRLVGGKGWKGKVYNREECKKLLRTARNCRILHMAVE